MDFVVLSLSGIEIDMLFVLETMDKLKVSSLIGIVVVIGLSLSVVEAAVLIVPELLETAVVLSLSGSVDVDILSLSGNEVVALSLFGTMGVTDTVETNVIDDIEDGRGTTEIVVLI